MVCDGKPAVEVIALLQVLILILLEYGLRPSLIKVSHLKQNVLILILLEYGLRHVPVKAGDLWRMRLNPYSIGIWSATNSVCFMMKSGGRLNPYSIGIWSATWQASSRSYNKSGLNPYSIGIWSATQS